LDDLSENYRKLKALIPPSVALIAVSKTRTADEIETLYKLGHRDFGENYVQELLEKSAELDARGCSDICWHFIGHLQTNKVKSLVSIVKVIHSVDSIRLAEEISKRATQPIQVFLNVNLDGEPSKSGFSPENVISAAKEIQKFPRIDLRGLMCIPKPIPPEDRIEKKRAPFEKLNALEKQCHPYTQGELSMGMSDDFEAAIDSGSTAVRVGTRLFGERKSF